MSAWRWVAPAFVFAVHARQIAEHGGLDGVRDRNAVESALARPQNLAAYGEPDAADLAAAYGFGIVRNHGFADGNKRSAWVVVRVFLEDNGFDLAFDPIDAVRTVESLAAGNLEEAALATWIRERLTRYDASE